VRPPARVGRRCGEVANRQRDANLTINSSMVIAPKGAIVETLSDEMHRTHAHNGVSAHHRMIVKGDLEAA
jgi:hypothetical protein